MPLIKLFLDICRFRLGPQDVPRSGFLLGLVLALNALASLLLGLLEVDMATAGLQTLVALALLTAFIFASLRLSRHPGRFQQTLTAALGCDALIRTSLDADVVPLITALALPLLAAGLLLPSVQVTVSLMLLATMLWEIAVIGHILRHALDLPYLAGLVASLVYTMLSLKVMATVFPALH